MPSGRAGGTLRQKEAFGMIRKLDHVTINIKDFEKAMQFYGGLLGLEKLPSAEMADHTLFFFRLPDGVKIELVQYHFKTREEAVEYSRKGTARHFAFQVDDLDGLQKKLEDAGYRFHAPAAYVEKLGFRSGLVRDPNGFELEFLQYGNETDE